VAEAEAGVTDFVIWGYPLFMI